MSLIIIQQSDGLRNYYDTWGLINADLDMLLPKI